MNVSQYIDRDVFRLVGEVADSMHRECYVVGGYVRDCFLGRKNDDMDFVTVGSGIEVAREVAARLGRKRAHLSYFKTYGTAQVKTGRMELEFVGARRESYRRESRNPIVEDGTLNDDQLRRDFTINAMAICLNRERWGELLDPFDGLGDIQRKLIVTPRDPDITFSDDPLRMMRAVRFATQLDFDIAPVTLAAITRNASRLKIITKERIATELMKIMRSPHPSRGIQYLGQTGLLPLICPELSNLKGVKVVNGRGHKDNFKHTMQVLDTVASESDNEWLRWAALFHDIGKPVTQHWDDHQGWTFRNHNFVGEKMVPRIFARMRLPLGEPMKYVKKLVGLHMRPIALVEDIVTDSAVRRMLFEAGDDIDDLMTLCKADITSKNEDKVKRFRENFDLVKQKLIDIEEKDRVRNFQPPVDGEEIMEIFALPPSRPVGIIKDAIKDAILDGVIANDYAQAYRFMMEKARELNISPTEADVMRYVTMPSPLGPLTVAASAWGVTFISAADKAHDEMERVAKHLKLRAIDGENALLRHAITQLGEYFAGNRSEFSLPLHRQGTEFQEKVWNALSDIASGTTESYASVAQRVGNARACRAVAQACHANPVGIVVPCHRVVASDGTLGGYAGGVDRKRLLLDLEKKQ
ncbi:MAG: methylated-DNA--[protein]-cysteine S-methyltransferase [Muribaculaceae bacterium]|nr:methylated-DNA--[protein]-cysteine S-methyltransferase [Muribaculaceae bacterium]